MKIPKYQNELRQKQYRNVNTNLVLRRTYVLNV